MKYNGLRCNHIVKSLIVCVYIITAFLLTGCGFFGDEGETETVREPSLTKQAKKIYQFSEPEEGDSVADITIRNHGTIRIRLFKNECPETVDIFIRSAEDGCFDGQPLSMIIGDYLIQYSDSEGSVSLMEEFSEELRPFRGALCTTAGSQEGEGGQYFIIQKPAESIQKLDELIRYKGHTFSEYLSAGYGCVLSEKELKDYYIYGGAPWLYRRNVVFGQIFEGFDVLDKLSAAETDEKYIPTEEVIIERVKVSNYE